MSDYRDIDSLPPLPKSDLRQWFFYALLLGGSLILALPAAFGISPLGLSDQALLVGSPLVLVNAFCVLVFNGLARRKFHREQHVLFKALHHVAASECGEFFPTLAKRLSDYLGADYVHIGRFSGDGNERLEPLAVCHAGRPLKGSEFDLSGMPCALVLQNGAFLQERDLRRRFPDAQLIRDLRATSYLGYPLRDGQGEVVGVLAAMGRKPLRHTKTAPLLLGLLAKYVSIELERQRMQKTVERMAYHDPLTEMSNWRFFRERLVTTLGQAKQKDARFGLLFLDVDRFKNVNQAFGHETGDQLLRLFAERLAATLGSQAVISRKGGDRFFVLLPGIADVVDMEWMAQRVLKMLREPFAVQAREVYLSISAGVVTYPADGDSSAVLLANADAAMHRAKELGGGRIERYRPAMSAVSRARLGLEGALRKALERNEFVLHYQPQYQLESERLVGDEGLLQDRISSRLVGTECLIRWLHPGRGLVSPMEFVPLAEETGLIEEIGAWVLETACAQLGQWQRWFASGLKMSINISARQLHKGDLGDRIAAVLAKNGLPAEALCLELTESCLMANVQENQLQLQRLRKLGVGIAIDDFGTGYSSLSYLRRFPVTSLKVDRSFVQDIGEHADHLAIVKNIIAMAEILKLDVVAEGVETPQQLSCLYASGCRTVQGYLLGRPLPAADFSVLLNAAGPDRVENCC